MDSRFRTDVELTPPEWLCHRACACGPRPHAGARLACAQHGRRLFTALGAAALMAPGAVWAQQGGVAGDEGLRREVGGNSKWARLVSADTVEESAAVQFQQMSREAQQKRALAPDNHPQLIRLRAIADRIIPFAEPWNPRANKWKWEVRLFGDPTVNAFCMPGGKIAFYWGILDKLQLNDDEVAMIMGHEVAHALREHARERMGKTAATRVGANVVSSLLGLGSLGDAALGMGAQLLTLRFGREDETEADLVGLDLASRAGYNPEAGVTLWRKMMGANKNAPPEFLSTHPAGDTRIQDIQKVLPKVQPLYARAPKPDRVFGPPPRSERTGRSGGAG
jgi:Zn-dependent protease with chaperone function